jgi:hypothetical protein
MGSIAVQATGCNSMKTATIIMSIPGSRREVTRVERSKPELLARKLAAHVRDFARRMGVAPSAVEYRVA